MKIKIIFLLLIGTTFFAKAQDNAKKCTEKGENINNFVKNQKFAEAVLIWNDLIKTCTNLDENFYLNGELIYLHQLEFVNSTDEKISVIKNLIKVYDQYDKKFSDNNNGNSIKKALYLNDNKLATKDEVFKILDLAFKKNKSNFNNPKALYLYFDLFLDQYKQATKLVKVDDLYDKNIEIGQKISDDIKNLNQKISELKTKQETETLSSQESILIQENQTNIESLKIVLEGIRSVFEPYITCENLTSYSNNKFIGNQSNSFWLTYTSNNLFRKSCFSDPIFEKICSKLEEINPSSKTAFYLGYISLLKNNKEIATTKFNESANRETEVYEKAKVYYTIASIVYGINDIPNANLYIQKALQADPSFGKAYLFLAQLYEISINQCANSDFERKAMYWLIASTIEKAGVADVSLKPIADKQSSDYLTKAPSKAEITKSGKSGKTVTFGCWINQTIEVPKL
jgi:hypothetical protein